MTAGRPTSRDVAELAGVSRSAVSLVLNGRADGMISPVKQQAIKDAARHLNYIPNAVALSLRTSRTNTIGVLVDSLAAVPSIGTTLLGAGLRAVQDGDLMLILGLAATDGNEEQALGLLRTRQVDGLIFVAGSLQRRPSPDLLRRYPAVLANCLDTDAVVPSLLPDEAGAVRLLVEHLLGHGHRDIVLVTAAGEPEAGLARRRGYDLALHAAGLSGRVSLVGSPDVAGGHAVAAALLRSACPPTAIIAAGERQAFGMALAAAEYGYALPHDLSLVTIEEDPTRMATMVPSVTAVRQPYAVIGQRAVEVVLNALDRRETGEPAVAGSQQILGELITGESVTHPRPR